MNHKIIYLLITKCLLGILCILAAVVILIPNYVPTQETSEIFAPIIIFGTAGAIGLILYSDRLKKRFDWNNDEIQKMRNVDASLCNKIILLGFLTLLLPDNGVVKIAHIQGIALIIIGLIFIIQFIGYCSQLKT